MAPLAQKGRSADRVGYWLDSESASGLASETAKMRHSIKTIQYFYTQRPLFIECGRALAEPICWVSDANWTCSGKVENFS